MPDPFDQSGQFTVHHHGRIRWAESCQAFPKGFPGEATECLGRGDLGFGGGEEIQTLNHRVSNPALVRSEIRSRTNFAVVQNFKK